MQLAVFHDRRPLVPQVFDGSLYPIAAALAFFAVGSLLQRCLLRPVAARVFTQEKLEGDFRWVFHRNALIKCVSDRQYWFSMSGCMRALCSTACCVHCVRHLRGRAAVCIPMLFAAHVFLVQHPMSNNAAHSTLVPCCRHAHSQLRQHAAAVALCGGAAAERVHLDAAFGAVAGSQLRLAALHCAQAAASRLLDYAGTLLHKRYTFCCCLLWRFASCVFATAFMRSAHQPWLYTV